MDVPEFPTCVDIESLHATPEGHHDTEREPLCHCDLRQVYERKRLASCLLVEAADGYPVVIARLEMDPAFTDKQIYLAYLRDSKPMDEKEGPYAS